jgi:hypothetical protein
LAVSQLSSIRWKSNLRGKIVIESKDELKKRGIKSPDRAEAVMLAFADRKPGISRYYQEQSEARAAREKDPTLPEPAPDTTLQEEYDREILRLRHSHDYVEMSSRPPATAEKKSRPAFADIADSQYAARLRRSDRPGGTRSASGSEARFTPTSPARPASQFSACYARYLKY